MSERRVSVALWSSIAALLLCIPACGQSHSHALTVRGVHPVGAPAVTS